MVQGPRGGGCARRSEAAVWLGGLGGRWTGQEWRGGGQICIGLSQVQEGSDAARLVAASEAAGRVCFVLTPS